MNENGLAQVQVGHYTNNKNGEYSCLSTAWYSHALRYYDAEATMSEKNTLYKTLLKTYESLESFARREERSVDLSSVEAMRMVQGILDKTLYNQEDVKSAITASFRAVRDGQKMQSNGVVFGPVIAKLPPLSPGLDF